MAEATFANQQSLHYHELLFIHNSRLPLFCLHFVRYSSQTTHIRPSCTGCITITIWCHLHLEFTVAERMNQTVAEATFANQESLHYHELQWLFTKAGCLWLWFIHTLFITPTRLLITGLLEQGVSWQTIFWSHLKPVDGIMKKGGPGTSGVCMLPAAADGHEEPKPTEMPAPKS